MSRLRVDLARLDELVAHLAKVERELLDAGERVDARVRALHGSWSGSAATMQGAAADRWAAGAAEVRAALASLRTAAAIARDNYAAAVQANRRMWAL
jgi:WXG100 family type VII secretion target